MEDLKSMTIIPVRKGSLGLEDSELGTYLDQLTEWELLEVDGVKRLTREFKFRNFAEALQFTNQVGELAEQEDHHPAILTEWGKVTVTWWTHVVNGLHLNDFISAAKTDQIFTG
jgi:4a-hydroxytetrahydrobiopterin dehydratase